MKILKLEPYSGISGDMFLGALASLLHAEDEIIALPGRLGLHGVQVSFSDVQRSSIRCRKAKVTVNGHEPEAPSGDAPHSHHGHPHDGHHAHHHDHHHTHEDPPPHAHTHRAYREIVRMIDASDLTEGAKALARRMFGELGLAESEMHGVPLDEVRFHEVGAEDSIIDLVGAALLVDRLNPSAVYSTPVCVGSGTVRGAHGRLPVPAPATHRLLHGMPTFAGPIAMEMTTPTGAVILKVLGARFTEPLLVVEASALGAGSRDLDQPNALRASLCRPHAEEIEGVTLLQSNLDNVSGELLGADLLGDFLRAGALDAWLSPILMKKGRPAHVLELLCRAEEAETLTRKILRDLPTLGVRRLEGVRTILPREILTVDTPFGAILVKAHRMPDGGIRHQPEYESCRDAALRHGVPIHDIQRSVWAQLSP